MSIHFTRAELSPKTSSKAKLTLIGSFIDAPNRDHIRTRTQTAIIIDRKTGTIVKICSQADWKSSNEEEVVIIPPSKAVVPGFVDCHVHAPQYKQLGTHTDVPLMDWLNKYTFPAEAAFSDVAHAEKVYSQLVRRLLRNGTTTALYFGSNHLQASLKLAQICGAYGQRALVGKTCSDQLLPDYYVETTEGSLKDTVTFISAVRELFGDHEDALVKPVVTPRFVPTCSLELLQGLGDIAGKFDCHVQTHAAESMEQVVLVREQHPDLRRDITILSQCNLLTDKTVLAHCTHLHDSEAKELARIGSAIASCPTSNILFARAILPIRRFTDMGVKIGLGTDIAGGWSASMVDSMRMAALASRVDGFQPPRDRTVDPSIDDSVRAPVALEEAFDYKTAFWLATNNGARSLGVRAGLFEVGMLFDALEIDLSWDDEFEDPVEVAFERWVCGHGGESTICKVWTGGETVLERN